MSRTRHGQLLMIFALAAFASLCVTDVSAQCAMCKATAANLDQVSSRQLNLATLILLCPPVAIFCAIFVIAYKHRNAPDDDVE